MPDKVNVAKTLLNLLDSDDEYSRTENNLIYELYENAEKETQDKIDDLFSYLCGSSLGTIMTVEGLPGRTIMKKTRGELVESNRNRS